MVKKINSIDYLAFWITILYIWLIRSDCMGCCGCGWIS